MENKLDLFLYIDDCIDGTIKLFESNYSKPVNIGSDEQISINQMIDMLEEITENKRKILASINKIPDISISLLLRKLLIFI